MRIIWRDLQSTFGTGKRMRAHKPGQNSCNLLEAASTHGRQEELATCTLPLAALALYCQRGPRQRAQNSNMATARAQYCRLCADDEPTSRRVMDQHLVR
eukprot:6655748-Alexandrium_andersonii.AAC.1